MDLDEFLVSLLFRSLKHASCDSFSTFDAIQDTKPMMEIPHQSGIKVGLNIHLDMCLTSPRRLYMTGSKYLLLLFLPKLAEDCSLAESDLIFRINFVFFSPPNFKNI